MRDDKLGIVLIGRNEGQRLIRALESVVSSTRSVVYVDSGSTDGSSEAARQRGARVVDLDMSTPFTAARARNAGFERLLRDEPDLRYVQFVDGDCEVAEGWLKAAVKELDSDDSLVAVSGWIEERHPERSVYNRICDVEWKSGSPDAFGGNVMIRASALREVGGWDPTVIAAEDDELALRLRQAGGRVLRLERPSVIHDVDMHRARQWWLRAKRCGYAYAQVSQMHGSTPDRLFVREKKRALLWGLVAPASAVLLGPATMGLSLSILARYPAVALRVAAQTRDRGFPWAHSVAWGVSCAVSPFPQVAGLGKFYLDRWRERRPEIIEHKEN